MSHDLDFIRKRGVEHNMEKYRMGVSTLRGEARKIKKNNKIFYVNKQFKNERATQLLNQYWGDVEAGKWEAQTYKIFDYFLDKNHSYIDMGAWMGPTLLYGSQIAKHAYGIEPDPVAYYGLKKNILLNPKLMSKITLFRGCISDIDGERSLVSKSRSGVGDSSILFTKGKFVWIVRSITFNKFIEKYRINDCDFIKMDIEGAEMVVLPIMKEYLKDNKPTLHISLHAPLVWNKINYFMKIIPTLKMYKNIYDEKGKKFNLTTSFFSKKNRNSFINIVATDKVWDQ